MNARVRRIVSFICMLAGIVTFYGCVPSTTTVVKLNREKYECKISPEQFINYQGKRIILASIGDRSTNTSNLAYYNPEKTIGYQLFYSSSHSIPQPVVSYFWYALQKGFDCAGIKVVESGPADDAELTLTITSLTDEEIKLQALLTKTGKTICQKEYTVSVPPVRTEGLISPSGIWTDEGHVVLEQRAYRMLDLIVITMLSDPDFQKAFEGN